MDLETKDDVNSEILVSFVHRGSFLLISYENLIHEFYISTKNLILTRVKVFTRDDIVRIQLKENFRYSVSRHCNSIETPDVALRARHVHYVNLKNLFHFT